MEWNAIRSYFNTQGVARMVEHQIESYEDFIRNKLPLIVSSTAPIVVWHEQDEKLKKLRAQRIEPIFNVKENTRGLEKALLKMKVGGKYRVYLPYSAQNNPIESKKLPFQYIIYQIELKNVGAKGSLVKTQVSNEKVSAIK